MKPFILPKNSPQGLQALLSGGLWNQWVRQGLVFDVPDIREAISYIRNKPESCRLFVKGPVEGTADTSPQGMNTKRSPGVIPDPIITRYAPARRTTESPPAKISSVHLESAA